MVSSYFPNHDSLIHDSIQIRIMIHSKANHEPNHQNWCFVHSLYATNVISNKKDLCQNTFIWFLCLHLTAEAGNRRTADHETRLCTFPAATNHHDFTQPSKIFLWFGDWITMNSAGLGSNGVTVTKFLQLLKILELYLELSYFFSYISIVVTVTEVTKVPKFLTQK